VRVQYTLWCLQEMFVDFQNDIRVWFDPKSAMCSCSHRRRRN